MASMVSQPVEASGPTDPEARLSLAIETWKRKLLDLTRRNRALHFRPACVSTVTIVDEQPAEVFRQLYLRERAMRFRAAPEADAAGPSAEPEGMRGSRSISSPTTRPPSTIAIRTAGCRRPPIRRRSTSRCGGSTSRAAPASREPGRRKSLNGSRRRIAVASKR
ncbi:MAG TPA: DUF4011 domain-containing protein [Thermoanaerobaculia bacterium]|nr:DUF4011 domain-containing protein [Thermoanaerobaculia bacterium]